ncbi:MAG: non-heme iron oxygenase ferredoxin subunit [Lysobacteraceae bacterium]|jgi:3-phenylpropionate/trans-cinnamate dioxygenase ferredoxin subunit|nr:non-heme iron oxygenase ferredoxin subunit [Xanthomonadaceae bacterium]MCZ8319666.1 non-heme iron oxygenase ferredoxin subunit [Silanimonas sp.]
MTDWIRVAGEHELAPGESRVVWDGDTPILVVNFDGRFHAVLDQCTHEDYELSAAPFDAATGELTCLLHSARFDVRTGEARCAPAYLPLTVFPVKVEDGAIWTRDDR